MSRLDDIPYFLGLGYNIQNDYFLLHPLPVDSTIHFPSQLNNIPLYIRAFLLQSEGYLGCFHCLVIVKQAE